ncbi:glycosyltransferase family 22 protein [Auriscalpium vulgare]|uniref:Glycosyltransferase family 22 protein n=1 Tax=Auriscalpium vulgare TaxID=40419 RepID=A0ACB8R8R7_9AGAM|nr:glycosyltransferase family 22 protein [Auriscalpium vulgare]
MRTTTALALAVRILAALFTRSFFQPDEYFQSLEPAHHLVFGYGHLTWEWRAPAPIRSFLYPALNVPVYWALKVLRLDDTRLLVWAPKLLHGVLAAGTDVGVREVARRVLGERYVAATFFVSLTSLFHGLALSRSLSNSLETTLTTLALSYYPWDPALTPTRPQLRSLLLFAALACATRVTNAVIWIFLIPPLLWRLRAHPHRLFAFLVDALLIATITLIALFAIDSAYNGTPTLTLLSFLRVNASPTALFYGVAPWHYYLVQALPLLCGPALPFVLHGAWRARGPAARTLLAAAAGTTAVFSCAGHKEWRFLHPVLPLLHVLAAQSLVDLHSARPGAWHALRIRPRHAALLLVAAPAVWYAARVHATAQIDVLAYLRGLPAHEVWSVGFLMPCHSTPGQAYLHRPIEVWALGCEPPLHGEDPAVYKDQTDVFYESPRAYLTIHFPSRVDEAFPPSPRPTSTPGAPPSAQPWKHTWPSHLVFFGALLDSDGVEQLLAAEGYGEAWRAGNGLEEDWRRRGGVRVWSSRGYTGQ